jgi:hypothetical protein
MSTLNYLPSMAAHTHLCVDRTAVVINKKPKSTASAVDTMAAHTHPYVDHAAVVIDGEPESTAPAVDSTAIKLPEHDTSTQATAGAESSTAVKRSQSTVGTVDSPVKKFKYANKQADDTYRDNGGRQKKDVDLIVKKNWARIRAGNWEDPPKSFKPKGTAHPAAATSIQLLDIQKQLWDAAMKRGGKAFPKVDEELNENAVLTNNVFDRMIKHYGTGKNAGKDDQGVQKCVEAAWKYIHGPTKIDVDVKAGKKKVKVDVKAGKQKVKVDVKAGKQKIKIKPEIEDVDEFEEDDDQVEAEVDEDEDQVEAEADEDDDEVDEE